MDLYATFAAKRIGQFVLVVFIGVNIAFLVTHLTPIDPVEQSIAAVANYGSTSPEEIEILRQSLRELYGLQGGLGDQYLSFWQRMIAADFGPSLSAFPTPVSSLIWQALPWTVGLLLVSTTISWILGNLLGGLAGYYRNNITLRLFGIITMGFHPIPYYIIAFVLMIFFGYLWPILPISGGVQMNIERGLNIHFILSIVEHSLLPAFSLILASIGGWFMGMRALVSNIITEDFVVYAEYGGVNQKKILTHYVMRNALAPQFTGLALSLGAIFNGAIITEQVFGYPGIGTLLIDGVHAGDYSLVLGVTTVSIVAVALAVLIIDLIYPIIDPRIKLQ